MDEAAGRRTFLYRIREFWRRCVRAILGGSSDETQCIAAAEITVNEPLASSVTNEPSVLPPLPSLLDPANLEKLRFRREILDWRDDSLIKLNKAGEASIKQFSVHVEGLLEDVPLWRRAWSQPANEVLVEDFNSLIRVKIREEASRSAIELKNILTGWNDHSQEPVHLRDEWLDSQLSCVADIGFKLSNTDEIYAAIAELIVGDGGMVRQFQKQIIIASEETLRRMSL